MSKPMLSELVQLGKVIEACRQDIKMNLTYSLNDDAQPLVSLLDVINCADYDDRVSAAVAQLRVLWRAWGKEQNQDVREPIRLAVVAAAARLAKEIVRAVDDNDVSKVSNEFTKEFGEKVPTPAPSEAKPVSIETKRGRVTDIKLQLVDGIEPVPAPGGGWAY